MKSLADNRSARYDYEILEKIEAGIALLGHEVRAVKIGKMSLLGSFISIRRGEAYLKNASIAPYQPHNTLDEYDERRSRKLLLQKKETERLLIKSQEKGISIIPLRVYDKNGMIKVEIAVGRGRKQRDKRENIKKRDMLRDVERETRAK